MAREERPYTVIMVISEMGRTRHLIRCPYCGEEVWAYIWSMAGHGKKCPKCKAIHTWMSGTVREIERGEKAGSNA